MPLHNKLKPTGLYEIILFAFDFNMSDFFGDLFLSYGYYITRALFQLDYFPDYKHKTALLIADSLTSLEYYIFSEKQVKFIMSLVLSMVTTSVKDMNFGYVKALQMSFSMNYFNLRQDNYKSYSPCINMFTILFTL